MNITSLHISYSLFDHFESYTYHNVTHIKSLPYLSVVEPIEGDYEISLGGYQSEIVRPGEMFIAPAQIMQKITHHNDPETGRMCARFLFLDTVVNQGGPVDYYFTFPTVLRGDAAGKVHDSFNAMMETESLCLRLSECFRVLDVLLSIAEKKQNKYDIFLPVLDYIASHYTEQIHPQDLADLLHLSIPRFYVLFREQFGKPPLAYINDYRLSVASVKLKDPDSSLSDISASVGFQDVFYFSRLFKKKYQVPPSVYRYQH